MHIQIDHRSATEATQRPKDKKQPAERRILVALCFFSSQFKRNQRYSSQLNHLSRDLEPMLYESTHPCTYKSIMIPLRKDGGEYRQNKINNPAQVVPKPVLHHHWITTMHTDCRVLYFIRDQRSLQFEKGLGLYLTFSFDQILS